MKKMNKDIEVRAEEVKNARPFADCIELPNGHIVVAHPNMPPHIWDGEKFNKMEWKDENGLERQYDKIEALQAKLQIAQEALERIASFEDSGASAFLKETGSYASFDEPASVCEAREALQKLKEEQGMGYNNPSKALKTKNPLDIIYNKKGWFEYGGEKVALAIGTSGLVTVRTSFGVGIGHTTIKKVYNAIKKNLQKLKED